MYLSIIFEKTAGCFTDFAAKSARFEIARSSALPVRSATGLTARSRGGDGNRSACGLEGAVGRELREGDWSNLVNDYGPQRARRVTRGVDCLDLILSNEEAVDQMGTKNLGALEVDEVIGHQVEG